MSERDMHRSVCLSVPLFYLVTLAINCQFVPSGGARQAARVVSPDAPDLG
jgi:hypothetical protein